ncbi:unnamed protein product [Caenorhabditis auriculariae]|uniref:Peroxin-19 n=1 Tax=Caenorhabditis auriculariae TaxID=2777116 RepID=A0A8S1GS64_9PELO|nr:unnamed protein product [Caenorhabditis auriculariae]
MSDAEKPSSSGDKNDDVDELAKMLDNAVKDFKPAPPKNTDDELDELMAVKDQEAAQKAASDFQSMLAQMVKVQEEAIKRAEEGGPAAENAEFDPNDPESKEMLEMIKQLMDCSSQVAGANSPEEFMAGLDMLRNPESPMEPFMAMMMQTLASKEFMYPPLKEIHDNFPKYFEEHGAELDAETRARYDKQYEVLGTICAEFESQSSAGVPLEEAAVQPADGQADPNEEKRIEQFERLGKLLVELQSYGYPPKELVGQLPDGWGLDDNTGLPRVENSEAAVNACSIM